MGGPDRNRTTNAKRKKNRLLVGDVAGEEFGLVPAKYLKRKATVASVHNPKEESLLLRTPRSSATTESASPFYAFSPASDSVFPTTDESQTPASFRGSSIDSPSPLGASFRSPNPHGGSGKDDGNEASSVHNSLKDTAPREVAPKTPPQRLRAEAEFQQLLAQKGLAGGDPQQSAYVQEWKKACLRAEAYQFSGATQRFRQQWHLKSELFGTPDLKVTMGDIAPNLVQTGAIQLVPTRDLAGRAIIFLHFQPDAYSTQEREVSSPKMCTLYGCPLSHPFILFLDSTESTSFTCWPVPWRMRPLWTAAWS